MSFPFKRPIGAPSDVAELEYCSALRQTEPHHLRSDGSISARDIKLHLMSRHGVRASLEDIERFILVELAGCADVAAERTEDDIVLSALDDVENGESEMGSVDDQQENGDSEGGDEIVADEQNSTVDENEQDVQRSDALSMDLVQQVSLLLIPEFQRMRRDSDSGQNSLGLIRAVLDVMLQQVNLARGHFLTKDVLSQLMDHFQEEWSDDLLDEMIADCTTTDSDDVVQTQPTLNAVTMIHALTCDTLLLDLEAENRATSYFQDAVQSCYIKDAGVPTSGSLRSSLVQASSSVAENSTKNQSTPLKRQYTAPSIDTAADTFRSLTWAVLSRLVLVILFFAYFLEGFNVHKTLPSLDCDDTKLSTFTCRFLDSLFTWLEVFIELSTLGVAFVFLTTLGNSSFPFSKTWKAFLAIFCGVIAVIFTTILAYRYNIDSPFIYTHKQDGKGFVYRSSLALGVLLLLVQLGQLIRLILSVPERLACVFETGGLKMERWTKKACSYKIRKLLLNALSCHSDEDPYGRVQTPGDLIALLEEKSSNLSEQVVGVSDDTEPLEATVAFLKQSGETEVCGGALWVFKSLFFRKTEIFEKEGIWLFSRLLTGNLVQWFICASIPIFLFFTVERVENNKEWFEPAVKAYEVKIALVVGAAAGFLAALWIAVGYVPSAVSSVLLYRAGAEGSLHDEHFLVCRYAIDVTTSVLGSAFWGSVFTGAITWLVVALIAFMFTWHDSREAMFQYLAGLLGLFSAIVVKLLVLYHLRSRTFGAFFRTRPAAANFMHLVLECWNLGLTTGYIVARTLKFIALAIFYIGRVDTDFFAKDVGWIGKVPLDGYPVAFKKDLFLHEAHRHPYIERWAYLYLLKLQNPFDFGSRRSSATWRILFVRALMPWMNKYRSATSLHHSPTGSTKSNMDQTLSREMQRLDNENRKLRQVIKAMSAENPQKRKSRRFSVWQDASDLYDETEA